jgi:hypothetical protein
VYHCYGARYYGAAEAGKYITEADARLRELVPIMQTVLRNSASQKQNPEVVRMFVQK